jgi:hypothetical protein
MNDVKEIKSGIKKTDEEIENLKSKIETCDFYLAGKFEDDVKGEYEHHINY